MDIKLCALPQGGVDFLVANGDLVMDPGLITPILSSLWTDRRADLDDELEEGGDPRGYWADRDGARWGSRLWLLNRGKATDENLQLAEGYVGEALGWMIRAGIVRRVKSTASYSGSRTLIEIELARGQDAKWDELWKGTASDVAVDGAQYSLRIMLR